MRVSFRTRCPARREGSTRCGAACPILLAALLAASTSAFAAPLVDGTLPPEAAVVMNGPIRMPGSGSTPALPSTPPALLPPSGFVPAEESLVLPEEDGDTDVRAADPALDEALHIDTGLAPGLLDMTGEAAAD